MDSGPINSKNPLGKNIYSVFLDAAVLATVCREVFNAIGGGESLLGGAVWSPKLRVGRNSGGGLPRLDNCGLSKLDWIGWKIGGGGGQKQAGNGGREKGDQVAG